MQALEPKAASSFKNPSYTHGGSGSGVADATYSDMPADGGTSAATTDAEYEAMNTSGAQATATTAVNDHYHDPDLYGNDDDGDADGGYLAVEGEPNIATGDAATYEEIVNATVPVSAGAYYLAEAPSSANGNNGASYSDSDEDIDL